MKIDRTIRLVTEPEKRNWNANVNHPLQSWEWGEFRKSMGVDVVRLGVYNKNILTEAWQLTFHNTPFSRYRVGYFPKGPKPTDEMLAELHKLGIENNTIFIQLEPDMLAEETVDNTDAYPLRASHRPLFTKYTFVLDLTKSEEELLKSMHPKTRYNIKVAQRHNVVIKEDNSEGAFAAYLKLSQQTIRRQKFYAHNTKYHKTMWNILRKGGVARLFTATYQKTIICAWILFVWKDTVYYPYGASSREHRDVMAPNLLLWEIAKWAKKQGFYYFDLWGAIGPNPDIKDPWFGFHRFKEGYSPNLIEFAGSYDYIIRPFPYLLFTFLDSVRWFFLKHKP